MDKAILFTAIGMGTVTTVVAVIELFQYRRFRQYFVNANVLPGTKKEI